MSLVRDTFYTEETIKEILFAGWKKSYLFANNEKEDFDNRREALLFDLPTIKETYEVVLEGFLEGMDEAGYTVISTSELDSYRETDDYLYGYAWENN